MFICIWCVSKHALLLLLSLLLVQGQFVGVRRPGSGKPIQVGDFSLLIDELHGSSGLQLKMDPGVPLVYAGTFTWFMPKSAHGVVPALPSRRCSRGQYRWAVT